MLFQLIAAVITLLHGQLELLVVSEVPHNKPGHPLQNSEFTITKQDGLDYWRESINHATSKIKTLNGSQFVRSNLFNRKFIRLDL